MYDLLGKNTGPNHLMFLLPKFFSFTTKALEEQMNDIENDFRMVGRPGLGVPQLGEDPRNLHGQALTLELGQSSKILTSINKEFFRV